MSLRSDHIVVNRVAERMTEQTEKEIISAYKSTLDNMRSQMAELYRKYETEGSLTYTEMARYNRLSGMFNDINSEIKTLSKTTSNEITGLASDVFQEAYYRTGFSLEGALDAKLSFTMLNPKVIQASVENPISGLKLSETLQKNRDAVIVKLKQEITQGLMNGESYGKMAARITSTLNNDVTKAVRVARTEAHRNQSAGSLAAMEHAADRSPIKLKKTWVATLDLRTRDTHAAMDGQTVKMDDDFKSPSGSRGPAPGMFGDPSEDINCRCAVITAIEGYEPNERRIDNQVVKYETYSEWAEAHKIPMKYKGAEPRLTPEEMRDVEEWAKATSKQLFTKAAASEPQITDDLKALSEKYDAEMEGLDFRLKSESSLERKLKSDYLEKLDTTYKEIQDGMGDTVRYTYLADPKTYVSKMTSISDDLRKAGYTEYKHKNYWDGTAYKGINTNWVSPTGQKIEVQFHTPESFNVKQYVNHEIYEKARSVDAKGKDILLARYNREMADNWKSVIIPKGVFP